MPDWIEWANLALGLFGALGTLGIFVLAYQWYIDNRSSKPYVVSFPEQKARPWGRSGVYLSFEVRNRRSKETRLFWVLGRVHDNPEGGHGTSGFSGQRLVRLPGIVSEIIPVIEVGGAGVEKFFAIGPDVTIGGGYPREVRLALSDNRGWRRDWTFPADPPITGQ